MKSRAKSTAFTQLMAFIVLLDLKHFLHHSLKSDNAFSIHADSPRLLRSLLDTDRIYQSSVRVTKSPRYAEKCIKQYLGWFFAFWGEVFFDICCIFVVELAEFYFEELSFRDEEANLMIPWIIISGISVCVKIIKVIFEQQWTNKNSAGMYSILTYSTCISR